MLDTIMWRLRQAWIFLRYRPWLTCPICGGSGGESDYWGEWIECRCYDSWSECENHRLDWCVGRLSLRGWIYAWLWEKTGQYSFRGWLLCSLGRHHAIYQDDHACICGRCWENYKKQEK